MGSTLSEFIVLQNLYLKQWQFEFYFPIKMKTFATNVDRGRGREGGESGREDEKRT
jgi:hypothetical protein